MESLKGDLVGEYSGGGVVVGRGGGQGEKEGGEEMEGTPGREQEML